MTRTRSLASTLQSCTDVKREDEAVTGVLQLGNSKLTQITLLRKGNGTSCTTIACQKELTHTTLILEIRRKGKKCLLDSLLKTKTSRDLFARARKQAISTPLQPQELFAEVLKGAQVCHTN